MRALGWVIPTDKHIARLRLAGPSAGSSLLADVVPAAESNNYDLCNVLDQEALGSCTTNMAAQIIRAAQLLEGQVDPSFLSRLAYYWARYQDNTQTSDVGTHNATVLEMAASLGIPPESCWPYIIARFAQRPGPEVYSRAYDQRGRVGINYHPVSSSGDAFIDEMERALTIRRLVGFGVSVSKEFCSTLPTKTVEAPAPSEVAGGHALTAIGHDRERQRVLVLNSWGLDWRDPSLPPGCCWFSYEYLKQSADRWIVKIAPRPAVQS
jgi:hypothetical protein